MAGSRPSGGLGNLAKHIENIRLFGLEPVVAINRFPDDRTADLNRIIRFCERQGVEAVVADHYARRRRRCGGTGPGGVARHGPKPAQNSISFIEPDDPLKRKIETLAKKLYGADGVDFDRTRRSEP